MNIQNLFNEIKQKPVFLKFVSENPDAFLTAVFSVLDDSGKDTYQLDFFIPSKNKIALSSYPFEDIQIQPDEIKDSKQLNLIQKVDIPDIREIVEEIKRNNNLEKIKINKIIAILKDNSWNLTCLSSVLDIIKISISPEGECIKCQKASLMDFVVKK